jgi:hypothetical protein
MLKPGLCAKGEPWGGPGASRFTDSKHRSARPKPTELLTNLHVRVALVGGES